MFVAEYGTKFDQLSQFVLHFAGTNWKRAQKVMTTIEIIDL